MISHTFRTSQKNRRKADISILKLLIGKQNEEKPRFLRHFCFWYLLHLFFFALSVISQSNFLKVFFLKISVHSPKPASWWNLLPPWCSHWNFCVIFDTILILLWLIICMSLSFRNALVFNNDHKHPISSPFYRIRTSRDLLKITWPAGDRAIS